MAWVTVASPAGGWVVVGGICQVMAWGLVVGMIAAAVARAAGSGKAGWAGGLGVIVYGIWQHRLPSWYAPGVVDRFLGLPWAGTVTSPSGRWFMWALPWWTACWVLVDLLPVGIVALATCRWFAAVHPARTVATAKPIAMEHVLAAAACVAVLAVMAASLSGSVVDAAASVQAAGAFVAANGIPVLAAALWGLAGIGRGLDPRIVSALLGALGLDACAGLAGQRIAWLGPQRLGIPPEAGTGQPEATATILALTAITATVCLCLLAITSTARFLQFLHDRPGVAVLLALTANTIDALATQVGLRSGKVAEANPMMRMAGMTLKWIVATILLLALYRVRPRWVWIVAAAYLLVVVYHILGAVLLA